MKNSAGKAHLLRGVRVRKAKGDAWVLLLWAGCLVLGWAIQPFVVSAVARLTR